VNGALRYERREAEAVRASGRFEAGETRDVVEEARHVVGAVRDVGLEVLWGTRSSLFELVS
jgi:hypothetical protein